MKYVTEEATKSTEKRVRETLTFKVDAALVASGNFGNKPVLANIDGAPGCIYFDTAEGVYFTRAESPSGLNWRQPIEIYHLYTHANIVLFEGRAQVLISHNGDPHVISALDKQGLNWTQPVQLDITKWWSSNCSLAVVNNQLVFAITGGLDGPIYYYRVP